MQPSFLSKLAATGWHQTGFDITYEPSIYAKEINDLNPKNQRPYMTLSFTYTFQIKDDEVYCAYTLPYAYSQMQAHLKQLKLLAADYPYQIVKFESFGTSLGNLDIPILKIQN